MNVMNNVLLNVLGMLLAGSATMMTVDFGGDALNRAGARAVGASTIATASQIAAAARLYSLQEGSEYVGPSLQGLVDADYLGSVPSNPAKAGSPFIALDPDGDRVVAVPLGADARDVCGAVVKAADGDRIGCMEASDGGHAVYSKI